MRALLLLLLTAACDSDETLTKYGAAGVWKLTHINDKSFSADATITFGPDGNVTGNAPCNSYFGEQTAPYPWFELSAIAATKRACAQMDSEQRYFEALSSMTLVEVSGDTLILSNDAEVSMLFTKQPDG